MTLSVKELETRSGDAGAGKFMNRILAVLLCLFACGAYYYFVVNNCFVEVTLDVSEKADFKIYWAESGEPYSEKNMAQATAVPERKIYTFFLTDIRTIERLRVDTHSYEGEATLKRLQLEQDGYAPLVLAGPEDFAQLTPLAQIQEYRASDDGLWVRSTGKDPNFQWIITPQYQGLEYDWFIVRLVCLVAFFWFLVHYARPLAKDLRFVPFLLFGVFLLIVVMAGLSDPNVHPDEYVHMAATSYYQENWLPPALDSEEIRETYSVYGVSRLNNGEVYYMLAGKFEKIVEGFKLPEYLALRMFNIFLFAFILLYTIGVKHARMVALPFLVSPQIWYVFSYCGSDAFALFIAFLAGCQLIDPESLLYRYLKCEGEGWRTTILGAIVLSLLLGILFLLKKNYYPFIAFFYLCLGVKFFINKEFFWNQGQAMRRLLFITLAGLMVFGVRVGADYMVNGPDRRVKMEVLKEELAEEWYKPSTELHEKHISMYRKARGTTLKQLIEVDRWFEKSFRSSFGVFGYFTISESAKYYDLVRWTGVSVISFLFCSIFLRGGLIGSGMALSVLGLSAALIGVSLYHSWTADFQAQGRYLFPIIPMLGILYGWCYTAVKQWFLTLGVCVMYTLGMYAFIFEALMRIPKVVFH